MKTCRIFMACVGLVLFSSQNYGQNVDVDINLDVKHSVDGISEFDRKKFITIHGGLDENEWGDEANGKIFASDFITRFLTDYDVNIGRNTGTITWNLNGNNVVKQDAAKPGFADSASVAQAGTSKRNLYSNTKNNLHALEPRAENMVLAAQLHPFWPDGQMTHPNSSTPWALSTTDTSSEPFGTATGTYIGDFVKNFYRQNESQKGQPVPEYFEVINEPLWHLVTEKNLQGSTKTAMLTKVFEFHNTVANKVREINPQSTIKIGGYTTAFPDFEKENFMRWEDRWKSFIDITGNNMDFWSIHLYDFPCLGNLERYRKGSNIEATFDMMEAYSNLTLNKTMPIMVSEYGAQTHKYKTDKWSSYRDWLIVKSMTPMLMGFMERPHIVNMAIPFIVLKAEWGRISATAPYNPRVIRQVKETEGVTGDTAVDNMWVYTDLVKFYQLWSDVKGTRIDTKAYDLDVMADAYVNDNKMYLILSNLDFDSKVINLNMFGHNDNVVQSVKVKHLFLDESESVVTDRKLTLDDTTYFGNAVPKTITLEKEASMILEYTFDQNISVTDDSVETKYYADKYYKPIVAGTPFVTSVNSVTTSTEGEAILRLGIGRNHGQSLVPTILFNNQKLVVPYNYRGDAQTDRQRFFGVLEIPVPYSLISENNSISITFDDTGGHISSVALQVLNFTKKLRSNESSVSGSLVYDGLYRWFSADAGLTPTIDNKVLEWKDRVTDRVYGYSGSTKPVFEKRDQDKLPVVHFNKNSYFKLDDLHKAESPATVFVVFNRDADQDRVAETNQRIFSALSSDGSNDWSGTGLVIETSAVTGEVPRTIYVRRSDMMSFANLSIGVNTKTDTSQFLRGDIAELLIYDKKLSDDDVASVQDYLNAKWSTEPEAITVTFDAGEQGTITNGDAVQTLAAGETAVAPSVTPKNSSTFHVGWNKAYDSVTHDITVTALYSSPGLVPIREGLYVQLDAHQGVSTSESKVVSWKNLGYGQFDPMVKGGGSSGPVLTSGSNGKPVVRFNGQGYFCLDNPVKPDGPVTVYAVYNRETTSSIAYQRIVSSLNSDFTADPRNDFTGTGFYLWTGNEAGIIPRSIFSLKHQQKALKNVSVGVFTKYDSSQLLRGDIAEILIYDRMLSPVEEFAVESYLTEKWFAEPEIFTVQFDAGDEGTITDGESIQQVVSGQSAVAPTVTPNDSSVIHTGWDASYDSIRGDITIHATYLTGSGDSVPLPVNNGLYIHMDASIGVVADDSGNVTSWTNLGSADIDESVKGSIKPVLTVDDDGKPVVRFIGFGYFNLDNADKQDGPVTAYVVFARNDEQVTTIDYQRVLSSLSSDESSLNDWTGTGFSFSTNLDGGVIPRKIFSLNKPSKSLYNLSLGVFTKTDTSQYLRGDIAEVLIYDRQLGSQEAADVEEYLQKKWFTSEPETHTVTFDPGTSGEILSGDAVQEITAGGSAVAPVIQVTDDSFEFDRWDTSYDDVQSDLTVTAIYSPVLSVPDDIIIDLKKGYNLIYFPSLPENTLLTSVFDSVRLEIDYVADKTDYILTKTGTEWSETSGSIELNKGYLVKTNKAVNLVYTPKDSTASVDVSDLSILSLEPGINIVPGPYLQSVLDSFSFSYVRNDDGKTMRFIDDVLVSPFEFPTQYRSYAVNILEE